MKHIELFLLSIIIVLLLVILYRLYPRTQFPKHLPDNGSCSKATCGAADPVDDPAYNMKNIVKQSILLEEHIAEKNKYCLACIVKHFLHIIGLAEEAVWLANKNVDKYPYLKDAPQFYDNLLTKWSANKHDDQNKVDVLSQLRDMRRQLIHTYFVYTLSHK